MALITVPEHDVEIDVDDVINMIEDDLLSPKTVELLGDFLERARPLLPNHLINELDGLLRDLGR